MSFDVDKTQAIKPSQQWFNYYYWPHFMIGEMEVKEFNDFCSVFQD